MDKRQKEIIMEELDMMDARLERSRYLAKTSIALALGYGRRREMEDSVAEWIIEAYLHGKNSTS